MDTTANGPAPSAKELGARRDEEELAQVISSIRRRKSTDLAEAAMSSKGDVTKMAGYQNLVMCLTQLRALEASAGNGSMGPGLRASSDALAALVRHKASFVASFAPRGAESVRYIYIGAVMALWGAVTLLCAEGVEYVPGGNGGSLVPHVKAGGAGRVADSLLVTRLSKFVSSANASGFDRALQSAAGEEKALNEGFWTDSLKAAGAYVAGGAIGGAIQQVGAVGGIGLARAAAAGATYALGAVSGVGLALAVGSVLLSLLLNARDIAAWVYRTRTTTAGWLEMQASFLEMNAATLDPSKRIPRERQEAYAARMRSLASHIKLDADMAERDAVADIRADDRALQAPAGPSGGAPRLI